MGSREASEICGSHLWRAGLLVQVSDACPQPLTPALINQIPVKQSVSLNTGYTSFFDGLGGTNPGWVYQGFWVG